MDVLKTFKEKENAALLWGNTVHKAIADALEKKAPLPVEMLTYQPWVDRVAAGPGKLLVEQKYAITKSFQPTSWFSDTAWYRGIGDVVRIDGPVALVLDWKTGKLLVDSEQLMLMAQCIFAHYPDVQRVRSEFVWLKEDCSTPEIYDRAYAADQWLPVLDEVATLEAAYNSNNYPPRPNRYCRSYCPVVSCEYHGKTFHG